MNNRAASLVVFAALVAPLTGCAATTHATRPSALGSPRRSSEMLATVDQPGPIEVESIVSAEWSLSLSQLINLDAPNAKAAGLTNRAEPVEVFFYVLRHPRFGTFLIDTGIERALRDAPDKAAVRGLITSFLHTDKMDIRTPLGDWLACRKDQEALRGVFFTHLHPDHVSGAADLPQATPIYVGPGEATTHAFTQMFTQGSVDRALDGLPPLGEWRFERDADGYFAGVVDVFGDASLWAIWTPGHTPGSTAYLVRTPHGPVLITGDTSLTRWGWDNDVEAGSLTSDRARNVESLERLRRLVRDHPRIDVRVGHQR